MTQVLVVGAGAIGGFYGALLAKAGAEVTMVCRSNYDTINREGITIESHTLGKWNFRPSQVLKDISGFQGEADYILLCTKVLPNQTRTSLIRPAVTEKTAIVFIQNGVEIEQEMQEAFPDHEVISGLAFICCNRIKPGVIAHLAYGRLTLGTLQGSIDPKTETLARLFNRSGIECIATADIIAERWKKCVWNAPFNPLSVLSGGLLTPDILRTQESFVRNIMQDISRIAEAVGHPLPYTLIDQNIASTYAMPPYKTSMLIDYENGHPMETEAILGNALRAGKRAGIDTPYLESVYTLMKLKELKIAENQRTGE